MAANASAGRRAATDAGVRRRCSMPSVISTAPSCRARAAPVGSSRSGSLWPVRLWAGIPSADRERRFHLPVDQAARVRKRARRGLDHSDWNGAGLLGQWQHFPAQTENAAFTDLSIKPGQCRKGRGPIAPRAGGLFDLERAEELVLDQYEIDLPAVFVPVVIDQRQELGRCGQDRPAPATAAFQGASRAPIRQSFMRSFTIFSNLSLRRVW